MEVEVANRTLTSSGSKAALSFGFAEGSEAHIFNILRNSLYSNKALAVLREYASNAWDAHREAGKGDLPIKVRLPTSLEPTLVIRDYGNGLSVEAVRSIYTQYGASTKRESNEAVGFMGIGSKSAFCYTDSFTITSYHGGMKRVFVAALDETDRGEAHLMFEEPCGDETGVEIKIAVDPKDVGAFHREAQYLFAFFQPRPDINVQIEAPYSGFVCVMGCIPYRVDLHLLDIPEAEDYLWVIPPQSMHFDIGEISIAASREEIAYTNRTKSAVVARLRDGFVKHIQHQLAIWSDTHSTPWQRRVALQHVSRPYAPEIAPYTDSRVYLYTNDPIMDDKGNYILDDKGEKVRDWPSTFRVMVIAGFTRSGAAHMASTNTITVHKASRLVILDTSLSIKGYDFQEDYDHLVRIRQPHTVDVVESELTQMLVRAEATGIPVVRASSLPHSHSKKPKAQVSKSHMFVLKQPFVLQRPLSKNWSPAINQGLTSTDVYVVLDQFRVVGYADFYSEYQKVAKYLNMLGVPMPPIFGIKRPKVSAQQPGIEFRVWLKDQFAICLQNDPSLQAKLLDVMRASFLSRQFRAQSPWIWEQTLHVLTDNLSERHPLRQCMNLLLLAHYAERNLDASTRNLLHYLWQMFPDTYDSEVLRAWDELGSRYPIFTHLPHTACSDLTGTSSRKMWLDYINLIDKDQPWDTNS